MKASIQKFLLDSALAPVGGYFKRMTSEMESQQLYPLDPYINSLEQIAADGLKGVCPVCGNHATFSGFTENLRESGACSLCGSSNRQRQMALLIRRRFNLAPVGPIWFPKAFSFFSAEANGVLHGRLAMNAGYVCSEYFGDTYTSGEIINGVRHEDLQKLSFAGDTLDLVLSSDILEHMPAPYDAHREVFRVLKPGGRHLFTVPFYPLDVKDDVRAVIENGEIKYLAEKLYHGDPVRPGEGILVWTIFGVEMMRKLEAIGFEVHAWNLYEPENGIIGNCNTIFEAAKPIA
ncbi:methyltransferase domain-containing protein [Paraburkholderia azotifigens]|uniref:methyltransferase domain-containing protein n=1 Tax=Paraburkholderia azotifigens TaxID=2057004 RepID=UPI00317483A7